MMVKSGCGVSEKESRIGDEAGKGTGSYGDADLFRGLQRSNRFNVIHMPFATPWHSMADIAYRLQVGVNLHAGGKNGDTSQRYK
jgi:hypothetical protein